MEGQYSMQNAFYYYNPDRTGEHTRQHGHFTAQHPTQAPMGYQCPPVQTQYAMQHHQHQQQLATPVDTPVASPQPMAHKPTLFTDDHYLRIDTAYDYYRDLHSQGPMTPGLSSSGSCAGSPPSACDYAFPATPQTASFPGDHVYGIEGVKQGCEEGVLSEMVSLGPDWPSSCPTTPLMEPARRRNSDAVEHSLSVPAFPQLTPSPSPSPRAASVDDSACCDPRDLTLPESNPGLVSQFLPSFCPSDEDGQLPTSKGTEPQPSLQFDASPLPAFEGPCHGLESEDDFTSLLQYPAVAEQTVSLPPAFQPQRTELVDLTPEEDNVSNASFPDFEEDLLTTQLLTPPGSTSDLFDDLTDQYMAPPAKRVRYSDNVDSDSASQNGGQGVASSPPNSESAAAQPSADSAPSSPDSDNTVEARPATSRRGRKQSLTEDPSKTFACDLCNRRFRRQEHLKRHHRSLHTNTKPFECAHCNKKFSRSDNLAQHQRTHGSTVLAVRDTEVHRTRTDVYTEDPAVLGRILYHNASAVSDSSSGGSDLDGKARKRKRTD
ncbi:hypothetical protein M011DRAFT_475256 [Sporormia fimetaria CBS 119925]|uniref:C2H2-type domain-containing protein n=1 Tax=Sporormia fimetaria CBS 119925 TaxID=1340428 RepID=A0A6A6VJN8_9PLEO|nr:hypothetical protein M011DRAFT_475256 [Sporormia fimetaria CBS 119925]